jgi:hypothetical protein
MRTLPIITGDLQHHSRGCYSACGEEKYQNRRAERAMVQVESLSWLTSATLGRKYPQSAFGDAWWNILFNQFHDLLAGSVGSNRKLPSTSRPFQVRTSSSCTLLSTGSSMNRF